MNMNQLPKYNLLYTEKIEPDTYNNFIGIEPIAEDLHEGFVVLWQHHGVFLRRIANKNIDWIENEPIETDMNEHFLRLRAFNKEGTCEYHFWRTTTTNGSRQNTICGRRRIDKGIITIDAYKKKTEEEKQMIVPFIKSTMVLRGVMANQLIAELNEFERPDNDKKICIATRSYIGYNEMGQAGYVDSRFVEFI